IYDTYTNYISAKFTPTECRYVRFALTAPRCQTATSAEIAAFDAKYGVPANGSGPNAAPHYFRIVEFEVFKVK
ncbi:MAG: hypothetical protein HUJ95_04795, partial [Bacteroidales bacterium]|nr:hypothetical protein [Bacteroidales bacterium]